MATSDTEIRKLQPTELYTLGQILNNSDSWKKLMAVVPKDDGNSCMFTSEHVTMIEQAVKQQQRSGADIFLSEWSTMGKKRPTCRTLLDLLVKIELFRAADYVAVDILKTSPPERPKTGPAATVDVSEKVLEEILKQYAQDIPTGTATPTQTDPTLSWSLEFFNKPVEAIPVYAANQPAEAINNVTKNAPVEATNNGIKNAPAEATNKGINTEPSDFMKFSVEKSDFMKFSETCKDDLEKLPEQVSNMMKFSVDEDSKRLEDRYGLQAAPSEDIPLCVRENIFQSQKTVSTSSTLRTEDSMVTSSVDSTDDSSSTINSEQVSVPSASQNIPVFILEYNEKQQ